MADFKAVIDDKCAQWLGQYTKDGKAMTEFLRPQTLFSPEHFDNYLSDARSRRSYEAPAAAPAPTTQQPVQAKPASMRSAVVEYEDDIDD